MITKKRIFSSAVLLLMVTFVSLSFIGCKKEEAPKAAEAAEVKMMTPADYSGKIVVWSFTDELTDMVTMFNEVYPNLEVEFVVIPNADEVYLNKINTTLRSRSATPDAFTGEAAFYKQFIDAGYWEPISDAPYNAEALVEDLVPYVPNSSRNADGKITALSWQATPGALFYRRSIAKDVLGTDDPAEVSKWTSDLNKFYELGEKVKETTNGEKFLSPEQKHGSHPGSLPWQMVLLCVISFPHGDFIMF
jgi:multiple sugar transport system substrate-binding protein